MKTFKSLLGILLVLIVMTSCNKDDDSNFEEIEEIEDPVNDIVGSIWIRSDNLYTELDLKDYRQINSLTTLDSFHCNEFDGAFICTQGEYNGTKTLLRKGTFNGESMWSKDYVKDDDKYYEIGATWVYQSTVFIGYRAINTTTYHSTFYLDALDLETGDVYWTIELTDEVKKITSYQNKIVVELSLGSSTQEILSIDPGTGHIDKRIPFTDRISKLIGGSSSIIVMTWSNSVVSLDTDLNENWTFSTGSPNVLGGYESGDQFIFYSRDQTVYSIDKNDGSLIWEHAYTGKFPSAIGLSNDTVYLSYKEESSAIVTKTLDIFSGEELDSFTYPVNEEWDSDSTKYYFFDKHLLLFNTVSDHNKANITLINISANTLVWELELDQTAYPHLIITPTHFYQ
ncbi:outer membrane protein assembly factor BamB family protein [Zobellia uliginosa]|uniref:outer membrane protein assembly factor BamB family protein n=1 Tax=Zobellia uliginosa TaxID=143224 RepID=UPI0026E2F1DC|nr:PQQ-binding-like beta-propeller repeat protein [Zobellia uliginosa]MDO6519488.1 PQQ-binding-like beta-propeller repeat protein [Zobellia uliginosa]